MKTKIKISLVVILDSIIFIAGAANLQSQNDIVIGKTYKLNSKILNEEREIFVHLPGSYNFSENKYPVLFLLDAETHFSYTVGVTQFLSINGRGPEMIVVGIPNTARNRDFIPFNINDIPQSGGGNNFLKFINEELFPFVNSNFRTQHYKVLVGHSLCGFYCFYTLLSQPDMFNAYIALSPWIILNNNYLLDYASENLSKLEYKENFIYFTSGSLEEDLNRMMPALVDILKEKAPNSLRWSYKLMEGDDHNSLVLSTIHDGLINLFNNWAPKLSTIQMGLDSILNHYNKLSKSFGYLINPSEAALNAAAYYFMLQANDIKAAKTIFEKNIELYPASANVYDSYGELLERENQLKLAVINYEKAYNIARATKHQYTEVYKTNYERVKNIIEKK
jgi:hypothetical protein